MTEPRVPVVLILSTPHAGSHLLSQLLGAHSRCVAIGELHNYRKFRDRPKARNVVDTYSDDPIFADLDSLPDTSWHASILSHAQAVNGAVTTLVDNSKRVEWCRRLLRNPALEVRPIHLIRDPRALVRYWTRTYTTQRQVRQQRVRLIRGAPLRTLSLMRCSELEVYVQKWLTRNRAITDLLGELGRQSSVVSYHDLATDTATSLELKMPGLGLEFEVSQLDYGQAQQHGTAKREYLAASEASQIRLDRRWAEDLSAAQIEYVTHHEDILNYLEQIDLTLTDQGLTRSA